MASYDAALDPNADKGPVQYFADAAIALGLFFKQKPLGAFGALVLLVMFILAIFAGVIAQYDPTEFNRYVDESGVGQSATFQSPNGTYWLGTDDFGRDIFSRIVYGSRISLRIGFISVLLGTVVGSLFGMVSGYVGGRFDMVTQRIMDALMALPGLILALMVIAALGRGEFPVIVAIALNIGPNANRLLRAQCLTIKERPYVDAARAVGASNLRIILRHILPNSLAPFLIIATAGLGAAILIEASLSFLGFGVPQPAPSWGGMLTGNAQQFAIVAPWLAIAPGVAISVAVFGFNVLGDALRDVWDPRLRGAS